MKEQSEDYSPQNIQIAKKKKKKKKPQLKNKTTQSENEWKM